MRLSELFRETFVTARHTAPSYNKVDFGKTKGKNPLSRHMEEALHWCLYMYYAHYNTTPHSRCTQIPGDWIL